jgi:hypothetical protein
VAVVLSFVVGGVDVDSFAASCGSSVGLECGASVAIKLVLAWALDALL